MRKLVTAVALSMSLAAPACQAPPPADKPARGSLSVSWTITQLGRPATCQQVGADTVSVLLRTRSGTDRSFTFPCAASPGLTPLVPTGAYDVEITLHADDDSFIALEPLRRDVWINAKRVTTLAPVAFSIESKTGSLALQIRALGRPRNCTTLDQGGAELTGFRLHVQAQGSGCAPMTFQRFRDGRLVGQYVARDCTSPTVDPCIEQDEMLAVAGIPAQPYFVVITGVRGTAACWHSADVVRVPASGGLTAIVQLAPNDGC